jgi:sec-independent protein translocase protein TatC
MAKTNKNKDGNGMSFLDHLEALRWLLLKIVVAVTIGAIAVFSFRDWVFDHIIFSPLQPEFLTYTAFCDLTHYLNTLAPGLIDATAGCFEEVKLNVIAPKMTTQFMTAILVSVIGGVILTFPFIMYQIWSFLRPALYKTEQKNARGLVFWTSILFISGILFGYFLIAPLSINFLGNFTVSKSIQNLPSLSSFMGILASTTLASGVVFELPILVYFLSKAGLLTPEFMRKYRKHSFVVTLLLSAIITPPDVFSQVLVSIPIVILYEFSIFISRFVQKAKERDDY